MSEQLDKSVGERLKLLLDRRGKTAAWLARHLNVSNDLVYSWISGRIKFRRNRDMVSRAAELLAVTPEYLIEGPVEQYPSGSPGGFPPAPYNDRASHPGVGRRLFPVLGIAGASQMPLDPGIEEDFVEFSDDLYSDQIDRFAIRVVGSSMKSFRDGDFVLVNPDRTFQNAGFYVVAQSPEFEYVVKLLTKSGDRISLVPESEGYSPIEVGKDWQIVGNVIGHRREHLSRDRSGISRVKSYFEIGDSGGLRPAHYS